MAGIIDDALKNAGLPDLGSPDVEEWNPETTTVNAPTDTVQGQLGSLLNSGSPYIQQARDRAQRYAASRGLINSSIAGGAGEEAAISQALPIASQDAATYTNTRLANFDVTNRAGQTNAGARNTANLVGYQTKSGLIGEELQRDFASGEAEKDRTWRSGESRLDREFTGGENAAQRTWLTGENAADRNARMAELIKQQDFAAIQAEIDRMWKSGEMSADRAQQLKMLAEQNNFTALQNELNRDFTAAEAEKDRIQQSKIQDLQNKFQMDLQTAQNTWAAAQAEEERAWKEIQAGLDRDLQRDLQAISSTNAGKGALSAAALNYQGQAAAILADPNMDDAAKTAQLKKLAETYTSVIKQIASFYNTNTDDLWPPNVGTPPNDTVTRPGPYNPTVEPPPGETAPPPSPPKVSGPGLSSNESAPPPPPPPATATQPAATQPNLSDNGDGTFTDQWGNTVDEWGNVIGYTGGATGGGA